MQKIKALFEILQMIICLSCAPDSNRDELCSEDFLTTLCHHSRICVVVWTMPLPYPLGLRQRASSLYTFRHKPFSSALSILEFHRICPHSHKKFPILVLKFSSSLLRKPIPPRSDVRYSYVQNIQLSNLSISKNKEHHVKVERYSSSAACR